jgi:hypothetical protein
MIPITVSYFTNHSSQNRAKFVKLAAVYSLGIIATFTILGMLLAISSARRASICSPPIPRQSFNHRNFSILCIQSFRRV